MARNAEFHNNVEQTVDAILDRVGNDIRVGMPLGLGKPNQLINALYARAKSNPEIQLTILTALSLEKPVPSNAMEGNFLEPFLDRVYGDCPNLDYAVDCSKKKLPANVTVKEFFFKPGSRMRNAQAQHHYISSNYTHAARDVFANGCNVAMQIVAKADDITDNTGISMSCNPDTAPELVELMDQEGRNCLVIGQVNQKLPYMVNDAEFGKSDFDIILDNEDYYTTLFSTPKLAITTPDYMIGLRASALIKDGGTLQIGIGALGDAIVYAAIQRHKNNAAYKSALKNTGVIDKSQALIDEIGGTEPFEKGLYGATEMFVDGFQYLYDEGILNRKVYDFWALQQLLNEGRVDPNALSEDVFNAFEEKGVRTIRTRDFEVLQRHGLFRDDCQYDDGYIVAPDGDRIQANVAIPESRHKLAEKCLGAALRNGIVIHGGFFLGPNAFYKSLNDMTPEARAEICMTGVYKVNQLDHNPRLYKAQRVDARFINTGIMATMSGGVVSDGLDSGQVVSGVGGQYNFVAMAHHLLTGRSILMIRSVREKDGVASSNVVWNYGHCTIPRHLRDIVITEYGIANLRSKSDSEVIKELLNVTDSRFQDELLQRAKVEGKLEADYQIPQQYRNNTPAALEESLKAQRQEGLFPPFPFGNDFTDLELKLGKSLKGLKAVAAKGKLKAFFAARKVKNIPDSAQPYLERMKLTNPQDLQSKITQKLLVAELQKNGAL